MYVHFMREKNKSVDSLKVCDYVLLTVSRLAVVLPVHADDTNSILALLLCLPQGSAFLEATKLALDSAAIRN